MDFPHNPVAVLLNDVIHLLIVSIRSPDGDSQLGRSLIHQIINVGVDGLNLGLDAINLSLQLAKSLLMQLIGMLEGEITEPQNFLSLEYFSDMASNSAASCCKAFSSSVTASTTSP